MADTFTLADLIRITGAKRRSLQLWADAGVIRADPETNRVGTGNRRRFSQNEAIIACIIRAFSEQSLSVGILLSVSNGLRLLSEGRGEGDGWEIIEAVAYDDKPPETLLMATSMGEKWLTSVYSVGTDEAESRKNFDGILSRHLDAMRVPSSMNFTIRLNTWLRHVE